MEIDPILNVLKTTFPEFKLNEIESGQLLDKLTLADYLSFNIHFEKGEENTPTVYITPHKSNVDAVYKQASIMVASDWKNDHKLIIQESLFSCRTNIIIDNPSFWESAQVIRIRQLKIIPASLDETICIETIRTPTPRIFKVTLKNNNQLTVNIWAYDQEREIDISNLLSQEIPAKNSIWSLKKYLPNQKIQFYDMPEMEISFSENVVKEAILIHREHPIYPDENYVLVVSQ